MRKMILLLSAMLFTANAYADEQMAEGKRLFNENCFVCHNADLDPPQAPPMFGVQKHYKRATADRDAFIEKVTAFAIDPTEEKAILKMAVNHLGVMPNPGVEEADVRKIAAYIHDETFAKPCGHMKAAMKMAKSEGDLKHFNRIEKNFNRMCGNNSSGPATCGSCGSNAIRPSSTPPVPSSAADGTLKQVMQQLGENYGSLDRATLLEDFGTAEKAAHAIAFHDKPSMGQRLKIMASLRMEMSDFKKADEKVHDLAIEIEQAAKAKDMPLLIKRQSQMLSACMACHTAYRSRVIDILK